MYESEVNRVREPLESLPPEIRQRFGELREQLEARSLLPWAEHCTECNWPVCYTTCELYTPRRDGACRLFVDGMARIDHPSGTNPYVLKIRFKRWGKLWSSAALNLFSLSEAGKKEKVNILAGGVARTLPLPGSIRERTLRKVAYWRRQGAETPPANPQAPDSFIIECYNPNDRPISLTLTIRPAEGQEFAPPFQRLVPIERGFNRHEIPVGECLNLIGAGKLFEVEIVPNQADDTTLYFGLIDFIKRKVAATLDAPPVRSPGTNGKAKTWKCIVWDLDNTLWDGVLIEDGIEKLRLKQAVVDVIKETDRRGILHSIASKNNRDEALKFLEMCGLSEYFLHPQIGWEPKSQSVANVAQALNIGVDSLAFVDDQPFEREEVRAALPQVTVLDATDFAIIPNRDECQAPVTEESRSRRLMYRQQEQRDGALKTHGGDYKAFLKACDIRLTISPLNEDNLERVYELAQRTNQMNFSGNRYPREALRELIGSLDKRTFVMKCEDKFGSYGVVGFSVIDAREPRLLDLMFSCRIQSKRIEHAFLAFALQKFRVSTERAFFANYRRTLKNTPSAKVFEEIGFEAEREEGGLASLKFAAGRAVPDDGIVTITENERAASISQLVAA
jgi:FkbH-like protein